MNLYNVLSQAAQKHKVTWDGLEAAHCHEGKFINPSSIALNCGWVGVDSA